MQKTPPLWQKVKEEPNSLLMKMKKESEKVDLKCSIQKTKIMASSPISSVQFSSIAQSCLTLCDPMNCSTSGLPVHHQLPEFTQTHVHRVGDAIQPSHPLLSPWQIMSLLFNMLSSLVIAFLQKRKCLLISWLQSPSASDFGVQENKGCHSFHGFPTNLP